MRSSKLETTPYRYRIWVVSPYVAYCMKTRCRYRMTYLGYFWRETQPPHHFSKTSSSKNIYRYLSWRYKQKTMYLPGKRSNSWRRIQNKTSTRRTTRKQRNQADDHWMKISSSKTHAALTLKRSRTSRTHSNWTMDITRHGMRWRLWNHRRRTKRFAWLERIKKFLKKI